MNIFYLDKDIFKCAEYHCDKHVVKMCTEYAQLLCSVHLNIDPGNTYTPYKLTHKNHPCAVWARANISNYEYLFALCAILGEEYTHRYGKIHKSVLIVESLPIPDLPESGFIEPPKCVHEDFKNIPDVVEAYRAYYIRDKSYFCKWTKRSIPDWFKDVKIN